MGCEPLWIKFLREEAAKVISLDLKGNKELTARNNVFFRNCKTAAWVFIVICDVKTT